MSNKNLQEVLLGLEGKNVKVGAGKGISFIYCDVLPDKKDIIDIFNKLDKEYYKKAVTALQRDTELLKNIDAQVGKMKKLRAKNIYKRLVYNAKSISFKDIDIDEVMAEIDAFGVEYRRKKVKELSRRINKNYNILESWTPLLKRKVIVIRGSIIDDCSIPEGDENRKALIIEYEGTERGPYWDRDEYVNGFDEEDEEEDGDEIYE